MAKLKREVLDQVKSNADLFAAVAKEIGVKPASLPVILDRNGNSINQYGVVTLIAEFLGTEPETLVEHNVNTAA